MSDAPSSAREPGEMNGPSGQGTLSARHIIFFVIAAAAPLGFAVGSTPLAIGRGGIGTAGMFLVVGAFLMIFAAGYTAMARFIPNAGALFSFIASGLGRPLGLGTAFVAVMAYAIAATGSIGPFSVFASQATLQLLGTETPWQFWAFACWAAVGVLGIVNIEMNMKFLGAVMVIEVLLLTVLSAGVILSGGAEGISLQAFRPDTISGGEVGVVLLVVFAAFAGFEATALFREEAKDPVRTIRRATYASIAIIAVFQAFVTWSVIQAFGNLGAVKMANEMPTEIYTVAANTYVGPFMSNLIVIFVVGSWFTSILAFHIATSRYLVVLGRDRAISPVFAQKSARFGSPWVASLAHTAFSAVVLLFCAVRGLDPYLDLFVLGSVPVVLSIPCMELLTAAAILAFFWNDKRGVGLWAGTIAPFISVIALSVVVYYFLVNIPMFTGREGAINWILPGLNLLALSVGLLRAFWMRRNRPEEYRLIGHWGER